MKFKLVPVVNIKKFDFNGQVYDLTVEKTHTYNIEGIVVHNSSCVTRRVTGHGVPQLSAIVDIAALKKEFKFDLIADGGCRESGDVAKALACGADAVMLGGMLVGSFETPGQIIQGQKVYRGMASREARLDFDENLSNDYTPEGVAMMKPVTGPVGDIINQICGGLRSALSYTGATNLSEFRNKVKILQVTPSGNEEGHPHGLKGSK
jgi:IMP dehydrogenase